VRLGGRWRKWLIVAAALGGLALAGLWALPRALIGASAPAPADVLLHLAIDTRLSAEGYVAELYHRGLARKVVCVSSQVSWDVYPADYACRHLTALGVAPEDVSALHLPLADCQAESLARLAAHVKAAGWKSALLVVHPAGSRFSARLARRYFERAGLTAHVAHSPRDGEELVSRWWRTHWKTQQIIGNTVGTVLDLLYEECR